MYAGALLKPPNRAWAEVHRYNLGELIFFNAYRWHSGHVPRAGTVPPADNPLRKRGEAVGFAAELRDGRWVLFRMCKGSTDDALSAKLLATDVNRGSSGAANASYDVSAEEVRLRAAFKRGGDGSRNHVEL